jgi:soluble lytic murein transglycosylase-like protein
MGRWANEDVYTSLAQQIGAEVGVDPALVMATMAVETGGTFNPNAMRLEPAIGDASIGLMQVLLGTARQFGYSGDQAGLFDPAENITAGARYLEDCLHRSGGNIAGAASAYNGGWRPTLGFGKPATQPLTVCLARDQTTGKCLRTRNVPAGEYSNQSYVNSVLDAYAYFRSKFAASPPPSWGGDATVYGDVPGPDTSGAVNWKLVALLGALLLGLLGIRWKT